MRLAGVMRSGKWCFLALASNIHTPHHSYPPARMSDGRYHLLERLVCRKSPRNNRAVTHDVKQRTASTVPTFDTSQRLSYVTVWSQSPAPIPTLFDSTCTQLQRPHHTTPKAATHATAAHTSKVRQHSASTPRLRTIHLCPLPRLHSRTVPAPFLLRSTHHPTLKQCQPHGQRDRRATHRRQHSTRERIDWSKREINTSKGGDEGSINT